MQNRKNRKSVDVVQIVNQVRRTIEKREARMDTAGAVRERVRGQLIHRIQRAPIPEDVKQDLIDARMEWIFDPSAFWWSRRPGIGPLLNLFRRLTRPLVKIFFNPDAMLHHLNRLSYLVMYQQQLIEDLMVEIELQKLPEHPSQTPRNQAGRRPTNARAQQGHRRSRRNHPRRHKPDYER